MEEESFEVQVKVKLDSPAVALAAIERPDIDVLRVRHYHQYDTYFSFDDKSQGRIRYREDEFIDAKNTVTTVRSRLTLLGPEREGYFPQQVILSRSRYYTVATHSLRFYREYFKPTRELEIQKDRQRFLVKYQGTEFFINIDHVLVPELGYFLEIKSRTWSRKDAQRKSQLAVELLAFLGASAQEAVIHDYFEITESGEKV